MSRVGPSCQAKCCQGELGWNYLPQQSYLLRECNNRAQGPHFIGLFWFLVQTSRALARGKMKLLRRQKKSQGGVMGWELLLEFDGTGSPRRYRPRYLISAIKYSLESDSRNNCR